MARLEIPPLLLVCRVNTARQELSQGKCALRRVNSWPHLGLWKLWNLRNVKQNKAVFWWNLHSIFRTDLGKWKGLTRRSWCTKMLRMNMYIKIYDFFASFFCYMSVLTPEEDNFCRKRLCTIVFLAFCLIGEYFSLYLFYFVNLTSSCSLIPRRPHLGSWKLWNLKYVKWNNAVFMWNLESWSVSEAVCRFLAWYQCMQNTATTYSANTDKKQEQQQQKEQEQCVFRQCRLFMHPPQCFHGDLNAP